MKIEEAYFIPHCDDGSCDLGEFAVTCPSCEKNISDYSVWWEQDDVRDGKIVDFSCDHCKTLLSLAYNKKEYSYFVKIKKDEIPNKQ